MAARRLIVILVLLLAASVVAAAIAPRQGRPALAPETTAETTTEASEPKALGAPLTERIDASARRPPTVTGTVGDQLELDVGSRAGRTVTLAPLGLVEFAGPDSPAHFNLLLREPGTLPITDPEAGDAVVGKVVVKEPAPPRRRRREAAGGKRGRPGEPRGWVGNRSG